MSDIVLVTAGPVYGKLDDNKLVSNRSRGIWAVRIIPELVKAGYRVVFVIPDIMKNQFELDSVHCAELEVVTHSGFHSYAEICYEWAEKATAAIMAAAVVNYIPKNPYPGKMPTVDDEILVPFIRAPYVIDHMRKINPNLTLIGCKLLYSGDYDKLIEAAYHVVLKAKCNAVVANDGRLGLRQKYLVHQDRTVLSFPDDFVLMYQHLIEIIQDRHYRTVVDDWRNRGTVRSDSVQLFDRIVDQYRTRFNRRVADKDFVFGSVCVRTGGSYLVSPREKGEAFTSHNAVVVTDVVDRKVYTRGGKATLNAPLLIRHLRQYPEASAAVHWHTKLVPDGPLPTGVPVVAHAPPGTARDNDREIPGPHYLIDGHGWIMAIDEEGNPLRT